MHMLLANDYFSNIMWMIIYWMVRVTFGGQVFCQVVNLYLYWKKLLNLEPPLYNPGYASGKLSVQ